MTEQQDHPADQASSDAAVPSQGVSPVGAPPSSYAAACEELDAILAELEEGRADVDALTERVGRARELLAFCEQRLQGARLHVADVLDELDAS